MTGKQSRSIYQIKVSLVGSKPPIWRRLLVSSTMDLSKFHDVLQIAMGWTDSHLHQFISDRQFYGTLDENSGLDTKNEKGVRLNQLLKKEKDSLIYEYDFGDSWEHKILLEKILPDDNSVDVPSCIEGKRSCPPEDCGGIWGYEELIAAIENPSHPEHDEMLEWVGGGLSPQHFDIAEVNAALKRYRS